jgi:DNA-binding NarL/FixJ family response regulator
MEVIKIAIIDDHPLVLDGIEKALDNYPHFRLIGSYVSGEALLTALRQQQPDVLLLDIQMPEMNGEILARKIHEQYPDINIIALTGFDTPVYVRTMLHTGCKGYLLKSIDSKTLAEAIESVHKGEQYIEASLKETLLNQALKIPQAKQAQTPHLTWREKDVLRLIVNEYTSAEIAEKLFLGQRTVEKYRLQLMQKLQVKNTAGLVRVALEMGLLNEPE